MSEKISHKTRLIVAAICMPLLVYIAYRPYIESAWFIDSWSQFELTPLYVSLTKVPRLLLLVSFGFLIPLHHWITSGRISFSSIAGALLFCLFPYLDHYIHYSYGMVMMTSSIVFWSGLALFRLLLKKNWKYVSIFWAILMLIQPFVFDFDFIRFASINACFALFLHFQAAFDIDEGNQRNYMVLFFLIMFEMISLQIRQTWIGNSTNWTNQLMEYKVGGTIFQQSLLMRDLSELTELPGELIIPGGKRTDLIKIVYDFMKPESKLVLHEKLLEFIAVAHLHLETVEDPKEEKWFWYFLERIFYTRILKMDYDVYNRLYVMFHGPVLRTWEKDKDFEFFHLKYEEKIHELLKNLKEKSDNKLKDFLESEREYLRGL